MKLIITTLLTVVSSFLLMAQNYYWDNNSAIFPLRDSISMISPVSIVTHDGVIIYDGLKYGSDTLSDFSQLDTISWNSFNKIKWTGEQGGWVHLNYDEYIEDLKEPLKSKITPLRDAIREIKSNICYHKGTYYVVATKSYYDEHRKDWVSWKGLLKYNMSSERWDKVSDRIYYPGVGDHNWQYLHSDSDQLYTMFRNGFVSTPLYKSVDDGVTWTIDSQAMPSSILNN